MGPKADMVGAPVEREPAGYSGGQRLYAYRYLRRSGRGASGISVCSDFAEAGFPDIAAAQERSERGPTGSPVIAGEGWSVWSVGG